MTWPSRRPRLKTTLLALLVPSVVALLMFDIWSDYQMLHRTTDDAYDRALLGPALALSNSATPAPEGGVHLDVPQLALAMLESAPGQRVYYRVTLVDLPRLKAPHERRPVWLQPNVAELESATLTTVAGMRDLPLPNGWPSGVEPIFYNTAYRSDPVRVVALSRPLSRADVWGPQLLVQVAESTAARSALQRQAWADTLRRNVITIAVLIGMLLFGVYLGLRPLSRLSDEVRSRVPGDLTPLDTSSIPEEIAPLVRAINHHVQRLRTLLDAQAQFLADASHQLRTPLAIMRTQVEYALREPGTPRTRQSLDAILAQLERSGRLTSQLLALAHARQAPAMSPSSVFDARRLAHELTVQHLPLAWAKHQDLGWDESGEGGPLRVHAMESAIVEAVSNILHNAIQYTPEGGSITVSARARDGMAEITVRDTGPGIPAPLREKAFERFRRIGTSQADGAGLGLAIARTFVTRCNGTIELRDGDENAEGGHGLSVVVRLRLA